MIYIFLCFIIIIFYIVFLHFLYKKKINKIFLYKNELSSGLNEKIEISNYHIKKIKVFLYREKDILNNFFILINKYKRERSLLEKYLIEEEIDYIINYLIDLSKIYLTKEKLNEINILLDNHVIAREKIDFAKEFYNLSVEEYNRTLDSIYFFPYKILFKPKKMNRIGD